MSSKLNKVQICGILLVCFRNKQVVISTVTLFVLKLYRALFFTVPTQNILSASR